jgi:hypothetical protein
MKKIIGLLVVLFVLIFGNIPASARHPSPHHDQVVTQAEPVKTQLGSSNVVVKTEPAETTKTGQGWSEWFINIACLVFGACAMQLYGRSKKQ